MSAYEYDILNYINSKHSVVWLDLLKAYPLADAGTINSIIRAAINSGLIDASQPARISCSRLSLTPDGVVKLLEAAELKQQLSKTEDCVDNAQTTHRDQTCGKRDKLNDAGLILGIIAAAVTIIEFIYPFFLSVI